MKLWVDDVRPAPSGYVGCNSVNEAITAIKLREALIERTLQEYTPSERRMKDLSIELIDIDHDAGDYASDGGDYIKLLDWLEETGRNYPIHIHSMNPVGRDNMRRIIQRNGWTEVI
jgi:hypothetical protein